MKRIRRAVPWAILAALCAAYGLQPDGAAALTIFPAWTWLPLGIVPALFRLRKDRRGAAILFAAWVGYSFAFSEEWTSLVRIGRTETRLPGTIRVVTLNCAGGSIEAAGEVTAFQPDIVLLQESPGGDEVAALAKKLFGPHGESVKGPDASIIARGPLKPRQLPRGTADFVVADLTIDGQPLQVVSLRLLPPVFRIDLFNPAAWTDLARNRQARRDEIAGIANFLGGEKPTIMGGDFNCQSGDRSLDAMPTWLRDSFYEGGRGWGHSAVNDYPLARIDQIWVSKDWKAEQQFTRKTVHSDHRMVICDLTFRP